MESALAFGITAKHLIKDIRVMSSIMQVGQAHVCLFAI